VLAARDSTPSVKNGTANAAEIQNEQVFFFVSLKTCFFYFSASEYDCSHCAVLNKNTQGNAGRFYDSCSIFSGASGASTKGGMLAPAGGNTKTTASFIRVA
jgi:hypothetical protein